jgi:serine/threonine-protein kinase
MSPKLVDPDFLRRFTLEAKGLANLSHRNIVTVYDHGESRKGVPYLVLEYLEGETISASLRRDGPFSVQRTLGIAGQLLRGMRAAHRKGIVHRDLKPSNVFLVRNDDGEEEVKILDFGIAKLVAVDGPSQDATRDGALLGTPAYMAPEQIDGSAVDARTDLYALGCVLFHLLSGRAPFPGKNDIEILHGHLKQPAPPLRTMLGCEQLPAEIEAFVARLLAKSPDERPADSDAALAELRNLAAALVSADGVLRAQVPAELAAALGSTAGSSRSGSSLSTGSDAAAALARLSDGSSASIRRADLAVASLPPQPSPSSPDPASVLSLPPAVLASPPRRSPVALGAAMGLVLLVVAALAWWGVGGRGGHRVTVETIPAGLDLIDGDGRILGRSPVTVDHDGETIQVRARIGDVVSDLQTLRSFDGRVLGDFSAWARKLAESSSPSSAGSASPPVRLQDAGAGEEPQATKTAPQRTPGPVAAGRPPPKQASPVQTATPTPAPAPAPARGVELLDGRPRIAPIDGDPGIGLLDDAPRVAPID